MDVSMEPMDISVLSSGKLVSMSSVSTTPTSSTEQNTVQYTRPLDGSGDGGAGAGCGDGGNKSANTSVSSEKSATCRPTSHYPTVCVQVPHAPIGSVSSPPRTVSYAVPYPKPTELFFLIFDSRSVALRKGLFNIKIDFRESPLSQRTETYIPPSSCNIQYSATQLQYENIKHRCKMLDNENQRLMRIQNELITDANRRVEMHVNEIRMLKEENKKLTATNKELRELCCFLDDDRQKTRRLAKEWQKFGRYTSQVMKQEMSMNQQTSSRI
ncbi:hypothetical protein KIN20_030011 [Parelaphostrongylus tenuis]|uniref:Uncharacterized protein n=1 Tax=Parelaphostrongylus tenuis TaxID=148309 RepID=A0AAD5R444_PARTN|nr:hypothetical protein KIN20_030011 [Parelaphostrongylus tenuis]